jgi:hypothetical protein
MVVHGKVGHREGQATRKPNAGDCKRVTGSANAALLLYRILYWQPRATVRIGGFAWIAKSREVWMGETQLSRNQYDRALALLKQQGVVATLQAMFGRKAITHLRLTEVAYERLGTPEQDLPVPKSEIGRVLTSEEQSGQPSLESEKPYINTLLLTTTAKDFDVLTHASSEQDTKQETSKKEVAEIPQASKMQSAAPTTDEKVAKLETLWKQVVAREFGGFVPAFFGKEMGQMKTFAMAVPPGKAALVMTTCIQNWVDFADRAKNDAGAFKTPAHPQVGFMLKYVGVAVDFAAEIEEQEKKAAQKKAKKSSPACTPFTHTAHAAASTPLGGLPSIAESVQATATPPTAPANEPATLKEALEILGTPI